MVYQVHKATSLPIVAMGGVSSGEDVAEFIMAGATMVATGTLNLVEPDCPVRILAELEAFMGFKRAFRTFRKFEALLIDTLYAWSGS